MFPNIHSVRVEVVTKGRYFTAKPCAKEHTQKGVFFCVSAHKYNTLFLPRLLHHPHMGEVKPKILPGVKCAGSDRRLWAGCSPEPAGSIGR